jgi:hypothetical protein
VTVGWIDVAAVRDRLAVEHVLAAAGYEVLPGGRSACPIHGGDNRTAFWVSRDGRRWACWTSCGTGDALDLAQRLLGLSFREALRHCAALVGVAPHRSPVDIRAAALRRERERHARAMERLEWRDRWLDAIRELDVARAEAYLLGALLRDDPEEHDPRTTALLDKLGDPYLREQLAEQRVEEIETEERAAREGVTRVAA